MSKVQDKFMCTKNNVLTIGLYVLTYYIEYPYLCSRSIGAYHSICIVKGDMPELLFQIPSKICYIFTLW